jgi:DNA-binding NtrC family response regulator
MVAGQKASRGLIYVVDDEVMLLELATVILEPLGFTVETFGDPNSALAAFTAAQPRPLLLITDYAMHHMNGMALIAACRSLEPHQKTLLISGTVTEDIFRDSACKPNAYVAKPYHARQLIEVVESTVSG